jgi:hypothetical protein
MRTHITASFVDFWDSLPHKEVIKSKRWRTVFSKTLEYKAYVLDPGWPRKIWRNERYLGDWGTRNAAQRLILFEMVGEQ